MLKPRMAVPFILFLVASVANAASYHQPGEVIVKYKPGALRINKIMNALYDDVGVKHVRYFSENMRNFEHLILEDHVDIDSAIEELNESGMIEYAQPNYLVQVPRTWAGEDYDDSNPPDFVIPCIPGFEFPGCEPLPCIEIPGFGSFPPGCGEGGNPGDPGRPPSDRPDVADPPAEVVPPENDPDLRKSYGIAKIGSDKVWKNNRGNHSVIVAVIDTGVDYNHEDLNFNMWRNPNPTDGDLVGYDFIHKDGLPFDDHAHGTHVAGTVGAVGGNGVGTSGVNQHVSIMALKFLSSEGSGNTADAISAIDYAVENGAKVLNNSWGGGMDPNNRALYEAIERAKEADVLFIAAAGNGGRDGRGDNNDTDPSYPAAFDNDNLIAVAATDKNDVMASFSNYGTESTDLAAPGVNVYSTIPGNGYNAYSGTSMACPHVAGAAALVWAENPDWNYKQVKAALMKSVDPIPALKSKLKTGGRLNVKKAVSMKF